MPAETVSLPAISDKVSAPLTGKDFLVASHYRIGNDKRLSKSATRRSTFKKDYVAHRSYGREAAAEPPAPAAVMHKDVTAGTSDTTETHASYKGIFLPKVNQCKALTKTNFMMDSDRRIESFLTSHSQEFQSPRGVTRSLPNAEPMRSYVPQGDKEKERMPASDYHGNFRGHDTSVIKVHRAPCMHTGGEPTIRGDYRTHAPYETSSKEQFPGRYLPYVAVKPDLAGSCIPQGDTDKLVHRETTQLTSYPRFAGEHYQPYQRDSAVTRIRDTNFKMGHSKKHDQFGTTAATAFDAKELAPFTKFVPYDSNASNIPSGDLDPNRVTERTTTTNYSVYHQLPPSGFRNEIVSGAMKRTVSDVTFGEPRKLSSYYTTTQSDAYPALGNSAFAVRADGYKKSIVPLDGFGDLHNMSTTTEDFPPPYKNGITPNGVIQGDEINKLRASHFDAHIEKNRYFDTTHLTTYTAKRVERHKYDSNKLQKSSVPIGTFTI
ncbi:stabilizer of axonemal microtubules 5-like [Diadema antillarum]|uniref:stabilizer of axonemal microtubules 5-like n=1 Tax=Diadema antillarum TaxID=105358 RepID=UPI003A899674